MFFTWLPELGDHIIRNCWKSWMYILIAVGIASAIPSITYPVVKDMLSEDFAAFWPTGHMLLMLGSLIGVFIAHEVGAVVSFMLLMRKHDRKHPTIDIVRRIARKGMLRHTPRILESKDEDVNAGAITSFACGHYIIFTGNIVELLDERERETVIAHEIAHLKHADLAGRLIFNMATTVSYLYMLTFFCIGFLGLIFKVFSPDEGLQLFKAALIIFALRGMQMLCILAYWRAREYLADVAAVALTGWDYRFDFIRALERLSSTHISRLPDWLAYSWPEFLRDHPRNKNRAKALRVDVSKIF